MPEQPGEIEPKPEQPVAAEKPPEPRIGHTAGDTFTLPRYIGYGDDRKVEGEHTFTVGDHDGHHVTVKSDTGGEYTMKRDAVKHFADDLNQRVDVPEHPTSNGINLIREGKAQFLGKGDDGMAFDTGDGQVHKVTTSVPYNLAYFRDHRDAIRDAERQVWLNNQAIEQGHDLLVPQQFIEHGEKGFTILPKLDLNADLTREQILAYRDKMKAFHDAGWEVNDQVQTGVDAQGNIKIFDTGKLAKRDMSEERSSMDEDHWNQLGHPGKLLREHGHYDDQANDRQLKIHLRHLGWAEKMDPESQAIVLNDIAETIDDMIANNHDAKAFVIDDVRESLEQLPPSEASQALATKIDNWESAEVNKALDARLVNAQFQFAELINEYEGIDEDDEPHTESLDDFITDTDLFEQMIPGVSDDELAVLGFKAYESVGYDQINLAGFELDGDVLSGMGDQERVMRGIAERQEAMGTSIKGEPLEPGAITSDGGRYEPEREPNMDTFMRNQYPTGESWGPAGFIMSDGALLDMSAGGGDQRGDDHRTIIPTDEAAERWGWEMDGQGDSGEGSTSRWGKLVQTLNRAHAIRFDHSGLLHLEKYATPDQKRAISQYINEVQPDYLSIRYGNGRNEALQEWDVENPSPSQVINQIAMAEQNLLVEPGDYLQTLPQDEWPTQHQGLMAQGADLSDMDPGMYLAEITPSVLEELKDYVLEEEIDDYEVQIRQGVEFPPLLAYAPRKTADSVALAIAAWNLGILSVPVITPPGHKPEIEAPNTDEFRAFWGNSRVVNSDGSPQAQMHGTTTDDDITSFRTMRGNDFGSHFGDISQSEHFMESRRANSPDGWYDNSRVYPVWLSIQNPLITDDLGRWDPDEIAAFMEEKLEEKGIPWPEFIDDDGVPDRTDWNNEVMDLVPEIANEHAWFNNHLGAWEKFKQRKNWEMLRDAMEEAGYDGIAYLNQYEGDGENNLSFIALRPEQIKSAIGNNGKFDRTDPRMRYGIEDHDTPEGGFALTAGSTQKMPDPASDESEQRLREKESLESSDMPAVQAEHMEPYVHVKPEPIPKVEQNQESLKWLRGKFQELDPSANDPLGQMLESDDFTPEQRKNWNNNMARMGYNTLKNYTGKGASQLFREAEKHNKLAFPEQPKQPDEWADDDYLYHIAPAKNADSIASEGLRPNQGSNFDSNMEFNIRGNVFLTEKSGIPRWKDLINQGAESRSDNSLASQQRRVMALEADAEDFENDWGDAVWDNSEPWVTQRWEEIQAELTEAISERDRTEELRDSYDDEEVETTRVFRVPKHRVKDYAGIDEIGSEDANATAYKVNNYVTQQVRWAKEQVGVGEQLMSEAKDNLARFAKNRRQIRIDKMEAETQLAERSSDIGSQLYKLRQRVFEDAPPPREIQYTTWTERDAEGNWNVYLDQTNPQTEITRTVFGAPIDDPGAAPSPEDLRSRWNSQLIEAPDTEYQPDDGSRIYWENSPRYGTDSIPEGKQEYWLSEDERAQWGDYALSDWQDWRNNSEIVIYMQELSGAASFFVNYNPVFRNDKLRFSKEADQQWQRFQELRDSAPPELEPWVRPVAQLMEQSRKQESELHELNQADDDWQMNHGEAYDEHLTTLARAQVRDLQLKVASNPNYWRWARDNYAVDEEGLPLIIFHGTKDGGWSEFNRFDVGEHIYGSTSVLTGATYTGGFTDDITPTFAVDISDIERTLRTSKKYRFNEVGDGFVLEEILGNKPVLEAESPQEMIVKWNAWIAEGSRSLRTRGVYPLVYRLQSPMVVEGNGANWNSMNIIDFDQSFEENMQYPPLQAWLKNRSNNLSRSNAISDKGMAYDALMSFLYDDVGAYIDDGKPRFVPRRDNLTNLAVESGGHPRVGRVLQKNAREAVKILQETKGMELQFPQALIMKVAKALSRPPERTVDPALVKQDGPVNPELLQKISDETRTELGWQTFLGADRLATALLTQAFDLPHGMTTRELAEMAEETGHDGIVFKNITDHGGQGGPLINYDDIEPADVYVAFTKNQVKSAHNGGNFSDIGAKAGKMLYSANQ